MNYKYWENGTVQQKALSREYGSEMIELTEMVIGTQPWHIIDSIHVYLFIQVKVAQS